MPDFINRSLILVHPNEKYIEWLKSTDPKHVEEDARTIREDEPTAYLLDDRETGDPKEVDILLGKHWCDIAQEEFSNWYNSPEDWPEMKNLADFKEYFDIQAVEMVFDLLDEPIEKD